MYSQGTETKNRAVFGKKAFNHFFFRTGQNEGDTINGPAEKGTT